MKTRFCAGALSAAACALSVASPAWAGTVDIGLALNGGAITTEATGSGSATLGSTSLGGFTIVRVLAEETGTVVGNPGPEYIGLDANTLDLTSRGNTNTLDVWVTETGLTSPIPALQFVSGLTANLLAPGWTLTEMTFVDNSNAAYGTGSPLASNVFTKIGSISATTGVSVPSTFSVTEEFIVNSNKLPGSSNSTIDVTANIPEASTWAMLGLGFAGLGLLRWAKPRAKARYAV